MAALSTTPSRFLGRRSFLSSFAGFGFALKNGKSAKDSESVYRLLTPECEVRMSVQYFDNYASGLRFRDFLANRTLCVSADSKPDPSCTQRFSGSMAIAHYHFRPRSSGLRPLRLRESVHTIDQDKRMTSRQPFERSLAVEREMASDIQAFGYDPSDP